MISLPVFSDVHGNMDALQAAWSGLIRLGLTGPTILNAGDTVAHGTDSNLCIDFMISHPEIISVGGNYDFNVAEYPTKKAVFEQKWGKSRPDKLEFIRQASDQISEFQREWLLKLPKIVEMNIGKVRLALCHYSPIGKKIGLGTWTTDEDLYGIAVACSYDIVVTGHTHTPFVRRVGPTLFVNPGSVGMAWSQPTYAVITIIDGMATGVIRT
jgi:putative phosphoesterase